MKELFEERAKKIAEMKSLDENAKDRAMTEEERTSFEKLESEIRELDTKIDAEKRKNTLNGFSEKVPLARDENQKNEANERASAFVASGKTQMRALLSSGTIAKPTKVGTDIAGLGEVANSMQEYSEIRKSLVKRPFEEVADLIVKLDSQIVEQQNQQGGKNGKQ